MREKSTAPSELNVSKTIIVIVILGLVALFLYRIRVILLPFILSAVLTYFLAPVIGYLQSFGIKRSIAVVILFLLFILIFATAIAFLVPRVITEISVLKDNISDYIDYMKGYGYLLQYNLEIKFPFLKGKAIVDTALKNLNVFLSEELTKIPSYLLGLFSIFSMLILIPIVTFYFLLGSDKLVDKLMKFVPYRHVETALSLICEIDESIGRFIRTQIVESAAVGIMSIIGLLILGMDYALMIGLVAGISNMIPYLGPFMGACPAVVIAFVKYRDFALILRIIIMFAIVQFIDNNLFQPLIMSKGAKIHPVVIIFAIIAGAELFGVLGMLFAVPAVCVLRTVFEILIKERF